jgi:transcriptional regulator with XRE-family HTH domain
MNRKPLAAQLLVDSRLRAGLTQRALAKRARTAQSVVARIELGQTIPSLATLDRLVGAAGFELELALEPKPALDRQLLDDVSRIQRLTPEARLREVANLNRFIGAARRVPGSNA